MTTRIAMWSGPRNISTALMRSWGNRADTIVCDEPLYAHYLIATGHTDHPGFHETTRRHETDWRKAVAWLTGPMPAGVTVFYQKHMAHHLLPGMSIDWIDGLTNCFLIRAPHEMLSSLVEFLSSPSVEETGLPQQVRLFERLCARLGAAPPVIDAKDVLQNPVGMLQALCARVGVTFDRAMLSWPAGPRDTDGAWAPYWYDKVYPTTTFAPHRPKASRLPQELLGVLRTCENLYEQLYAHRIMPPPQDRTTASKSSGTS